jgi:hypothetical protein
MRRGENMPGTLGACPWRTLRITRGVEFTPVVRREIRGVIHRREQSEVGVSVRVFEVSTVFTGSIDTARDLF